MNRFPNHAAVKSKRSELLVMWFPVCAIWAMSARADIRVAIRAHIGWNTFDVRVTLRADNIALNPAPQAMGRKNPIDGVPHPTWQLLFHGSKISRSEGVLVEKLDRWPKNR